MTGGVDLLAGSTLVYEVGVQVANVENPDTRSHLH